MSEHMVSRIGEAAERLHTLCRDRLWVSSDLSRLPVSFQANKGKLE